MKWTVVSRPFIEDWMLTWNGYKAFLKGVFTSFDFGYSIFGDPVWDMILPLIPVTITINLIAYGIYVITGVILGLLCAFYKNSLFDHLVSGIILTLGSIPTIVFVFALMIIFGYRLPLLPPLYNMRDAGLKGDILVLIIPIVTLSMVPIATILRLLRGEIDEILKEEYLLVARAKGLNKRQLIFRHVFKNSLTTMLPELTNLFLITLGVSFFVEVVYRIPGIASLMYDSIVYEVPGGGHTVFFDNNVIIAIGFIYSVLGLIVGLINDLLLPLIDPRIKIGLKSERK
jgi:oligopeptide transport system permease protein